MNSAQASRRDLLKAFAATGTGALLPFGISRAQVSSTPRAKPGPIDVHHHMTSPGYVKAMQKDMAATGFNLRPWTPATSLETMDKHGIATAMLSPIQRLVMDSMSDRSERARTLVRENNEYGAQAVKDHPTRFGLFAALPLPDTDGSLREIEYAFDVLKADGIGLMTCVAGRYPGDAAFAPVFDELARRQAVVYFHPTAAPCAYALPEIPAATLEFPFDTTRAVASLLFAGTFARCRAIRFIFSHAGGTVPFLAERIARLASAKPAYHERLPEGVIPELKRLYYDTALSANRFAFRALLELVLPSNVLFGSDYPFAPEPTMTATIKGLGELGLSAGDLRAIERENALALFPGLGAR